MLLLYWLTSASTFNVLNYRFIGSCNITSPPLRRGEEGKVRGQSDDPRAVNGDVFCALSLLNHIVTIVNAKAGGEGRIPKVGGDEDVGGEAAPLWTDSRMRAKSCRALMSNSICTRLC